MHEPAEPQPGTLAATAAELAPLLQAAGLKRTQVLAAQKLNNGPTFWALLLDDPDTVFALQPNAAALHALDTELAVAAVIPETAELRLFPSL